MNWTTENIPDQTGKTVIVTGANSGIGFDAARVLAEKGARVILACRSQNKGQEALDKIKARVPNALVELGSLDLSSLESVRSFASWFKQNHNQLDLLINNAGIMTTPFGHTADGFELQLGTNHFGHFALTGLLIDLVQATPNARVVTLSSQAHRIGKIDFDNLNSEKGYNKYRAYGQSKLANLMFAYELERRLRKTNSNVISVAAHPGSTSTDLARHSRLLNLFFILGLSQDVTKGSLPTLRAACDPNTQGGDYYGPGGFMQLVGPPVKEQSTKRSHDKEVARRLWQVSEQMTGISYLSD